MKYAIDKSFDVAAVMQIPQIKKLKGYKNCYRIKIDDYRLGLYLENDTLVLSRLLPRKDIYKKFP